MRPVAAVISVILVLTVTLLGDAPPADRSDSTASVMGMNLHAAVTTHNQQGSPVLVEAEVVNKDSHRLYWFPAGPKFRISLTTADGKQVPLSNGGMDQNVITPPLRLSPGRSAATKMDLSKMYDLKERQLYLVHVTVPFCADPKERSQVIVVPFSVGTPPPLEMDRDGI